MRLFDKPYEEVHRWLDEFDGSERYGFRHRKVHHHEAGIVVGSLDRKQER
jgi:hypothetical protein